LDGRAKPQGVWGLEPTQRQFALWVMQSLPGCGPETAKRIYEMYGVPFGWRVTEEDLCRVEGVGKKKAARMWRALGAV
jgi:hypothetical protein